MDNDLIDIDLTLGSKATRRIQVSRSMWDDEDDRRTIGLHLYDALKELEAEFPAATE